MVKAYIVNKNTPKKLATSFWSSEPYSFMRTSKGRGDRCVHSDRVSGINHLWVTMTASW
ncbi:Uncharacterised protein [Bacillus freudenreichii]|nr:Uncharacterised protein [Bacillus freudenreichii]